MPDSTDGTIERIEGGYVIRFERRFANPVAEVWSALTTPAQLQAWIGADEIELELAPGGNLISRTSGPPEVVEAILAEGGALETRDTVLEVEPEHIFTHTFGGSPTSVVCWELSADGAGCLLRLTHTEHTDVDGEAAGSFMAGWHDLLDCLGDLMAGATPTHSMERWEANKARYDAIASGG